MKFSHIKVPLKWSLGVLGAILVGAIGSGVWQSVLGPAVHASTRWVLDLVSLGLESYKNGVYQQIAADNQSVVAVETLAWVTIMSALAIGLLTGFIWGMSSNSRDTLDEPQSSEPDITVNTKLVDAAIRKGMARLGLYATLLFMNSFFLISSYRWRK